MSNTFDRLGAGHVEYIARYSGLREEFVDLFRPTFDTEHPKFLLAVIDYKKYPRWDSCMSMYHLFIRAVGGGRLVALNGRADANIIVITESRVNISEAARLDINTKMEARRQQEGGMGDPRIFDAAFGEVLRATNGQLDVRKRVVEFVQSRHIHASASGELSMFA
jgi:hypothetical protein